jgi:hypothetical protein
VLSFIYSTVTFGSAVEINLAKGQSAVLIPGANTETILHFEHVGGSLGSETITGTAVANQLDGNAGNDVFRFDTALDAHGNVATISDFEVGTDEIQLENSTFAMLSPRSQLLAGDFAKVSLVDGCGNATVDAGVNVVCDQSFGRLYYDADGGDAVNRTWFATLTGSPDWVTNADFAVT